MEKLQVEEEKLRLMVFTSALELGKKVDEHLLRMYGLDPERNTFIVPTTQNFFDDGHLKVQINETVRGKDMFLLTDVGNYSLAYQMHGFLNHTSPNDLLMELKDGIGACNCHAKTINIVMPLLYAGRQHRRNTRENLTCGMVLHELDQMSRVNSFITFDAHDQGVEHAIHNMEFDNFAVSNVICEQFIANVSKEELMHLAFVAPDNGATGRRNIYLNSFRSDLIHKEAGSFIKQRDYNRVVDGKNPIISHDYCGTEDLTGYTAIVADDMISSGGSMFDVMDELHKRGVKHIYIFVTYALFTRGIERFDTYYKNGILSGIYTTNLSYIPEDYQKRDYMHVCDCSFLLAQIIYNIHNDISISKLLRDKTEPALLLAEKLNEKLEEK